MVSIYKFLKRSVFGGPKVQGLIAVKLSEAAFDACLMFTLDRIGSKYGLRYS